MNEKPFQNGSNKLVYAFIDQTFFSLTQLASTCTIHFIAQSIHSIPWFPVNHSTCELLSYQDTPKALAECQIKKLCLPTYHLLTRTGTITYILDFQLVIYSGFPFTYSWASFIVRILNERFFWYRVWIRIKVWFEWTLQYVVYDKININKLLLHYNIWSFYFFVVISLQQVTVGLGISFIRRQILLIEEITIPRWRNGLV